MEEVHFEDLGPWHHLIFCAKLVNNDDGRDDEEKFAHRFYDEEKFAHRFYDDDLWFRKKHVTNCMMCQRSVVGHPVYKCLECNFVQHQSCINQKKYSERDQDATNFHGSYYSFRKKRHHLILIEDVENTGNEEVVVCAGCDEPVFGRPAYKCSMPNCTFLLHKWCADLPHSIQHPMHPEHTLFLKDKTYVMKKAVWSTLYCDACGKVCEESLFYRCSLCKFIVHIKCASRRRINADDFHQHAFVSTPTQIQFTCQVCGEERKDIACICSICRLMIHSKCTHFQPTIPTSIHEHPFTRTYSLRQVKKQQDRAFCKLCGKEVNIEYGAYYCQTCDHHFAHLKCAYRRINYNKLASNSDDYEPHVVHLVEGIKPVEDPRKVQHSLSDKKLKVDHKRCDACMQFIIFDAYAQFNFLLHNRCTKLPDTITRMLFHQHPLTLISKDPSTNGLFWCALCRRSRNGFAYRCDECDYNCDVQCCLIPDVLDHEGHPHPLYMSIQSSDEACNACNACGEIVYRIVKFNCNDCCNNFTLCIRCATLPLVARYEYDAHLLQLAYTREYDPEEYYCLICEEERHADYWFYYCEECKFTAHPQCVIGKNPGIEYGRTYKDKHHQHLLTVVEKTKHSPSCDACNKSFDEGVALECTRCKFNVHYRNYYCNEQFYSGNCMEWWKQDKLLGRN